MKKFVPLKYIIGMTVLFIVNPLVLILLIVYIIGLNNFTIAICIFSGSFVVIGPITYFLNQENASVVFKDKKIINYMNDGTLNFGWAEEIKRIKKIKIANNKEAKEYYKNCKSKKVLLIDFGSYNIKYISVSLFTNSQINKMIKYIENNK